MPSRKPQAKPLEPFEIESDRPRIPDVGEYVRSLGKLVKVEEIPQPTLVDYIFEEVTATIRAMADGKHVKQFSTFNEIYGEGTGIAAAIEEAKKLHAQYNGALTFVVEKETSQHRHRLDESGRECFYAREFRHFRSLERGATWNVAEPVVEVVWSSDSEATP